LNRGGILASTTPAAKEIARLTKASAAVGKPLYSQPSRGQCGGNSLWTKYKKWPVLLAAVSRRPKIYDLDTRNLGPNVVLSMEKGLNPMCRSERQPDVEDNVANYPNSTIEANVSLVPLNFRTTGGANQLRILEEGPKEEGSARTAKLPAFQDSR
jgi:hypothetical protein